MRKIFYFSFVLYTLYEILHPTVVYAQKKCVPVFGGGQGSCINVDTISLDKKVLNPKTNQFVDNLGVNDPHYQPQSPIFFKITVTNNTNKPISNLTIKEIFPSLVEFAQGEGDFNPISKTLTMKIDSLSPSETKTINVSGRIVDNSRLTQDKTVVCVINRAAGELNGQLNQDSSQFCIERQKETSEQEQTGSLPGTTKGGLQVFTAPNQTTNPPTGPEALVASALLPLGVIGALLRKHS